MYSEKSIAEILTQPEMNSTLKVKLAQVNKLMCRRFMFPTRSNIAPESGVITEIFVIVVAMYKPKVCHGDLVMKVDSVSSKLRKITSRIVQPDFADFQLEMKT